jgi:hypothetical protein
LPENVKKTKNFREGTMELTKEQLEFIRERSREIDFGNITINFAGDPNNIVTINAEKRFRYHSQKSQATEGEPVDRRRSGRY